MLLPRLAPPPTFRFPGSVRLLSGLLLLAVSGGCLSDEQKAEKEERARLTMEMFRELIEEGTMTPVESMEDAFAGITPEMGETPEQRREAGRAPGVELPTAPEEVPEPPENYVERPPVNPFAEFGKRIKVNRENGLITKPFPMPKGLAESTKAFLKSYAGFEVYDVTPGAPKDLDKVGIDVVSGMSSAPNQSWLVVTANPALLSDVEYFINTFAASPPQIEIEAKIVEWVTRDSLDLGMQDASAIFPEHTLIGSLGWSFPNSAGDISGGEFLANLGTVQDAVTYAAMFEALDAFENVQIISRPKVATNNGLAATIQSTTRYPYLTITNLANNGVATTKLDFLQFGVKLEATPQLVGTDTVELKIHVEESQQVGSAVTLSIGGGDSAGQITSPIMSTRQADATVTLKPGQAVILGGLITERITESTRGIPVLKDIPVLGHLFKSSLDETEKTTLLFFIRPRILEGTDLTQEF